MSALFTDGSPVVSPSTVWALCPASWILMSMLGVQHMGDLQTGGSLESTWYRFLLKEVNAAFKAIL